MESAPEKPTKPLTGLEALASHMGLSRKQVHENKEPDTKPLTVSENLAQTLGPNREHEPSKPMERHASHIVDITDQYFGKALIITGAAPPNGEESPREGIQTAPEKPPET